MNWLTLPRYQKAVQKIARMSPDQRAVLNTALADEAFADAEQRKALQSMSDRIDRERLANRLDVGKRGMEQSYDLKNRALDLRSQEHALADAKNNALMDYRMGKLGLGSDELAWKAGVFDANQAYNDRALQNRISDFDYNTSQGNIATALGAANAALSGYLGYRNMQANNQRAKALRSIGFGV